MTTGPLAALQLALAVLLPAPVGHLPAPTICTTRAAMQSGLVRANESLAGRFLNSRGDLIELWTDPPSGAWTMIIIRHDTPWLACVIELGQQSIDERPIYRRAREWPDDFNPNP